MVNRYARGAKSLADLDYGPFPDVTVAIPEIAALATAARGAGCPILPVFPGSPVTPAIRR
jgi:hypothetical protein